MFYFNSDNILTGFIKNLLKSTYIPTLPIWNTNKYLYENKYYIYNDNIIKAIKNYNPNDWLLRDDNKVQNNKNEIKPITDFIEIISPYVHNNYNKCFNSTYTSYISGYDSETHKYLGNYLRMIRDTTNVDLMQYYNCFCNIYSDKLRIIEDKIIENGNIIIKDKVSINDKTQYDGLTTILIPIIFDQVYTLYFNTRLPIKYGYCLYDGTDLLHVKDAIEYNTGTIPYCSFNQPCIIKSISGKNNIEQEKYLYLVLQVPKDFKSNLIVLEGNYKLNKFLNESSVDGNKNFKPIYTNSLPQIHGAYGLNINFDNTINKLYNSVPSLTRQLNINIPAFSDRLIEYLVNNVITKNDLISENIARTQRYTSTYKAKDLFTKVFDYTKNIEGIWTNDLRSFIFNAITKDYKYPIKIDINGYVDKDSENIILGGKL